MAWTDGLWPVKLLRTISFLDAFSLGYEIEVQFDFTASKIKKLHRGTNQKCHRTQKYEDKTVTFYIEFEKVCLISDF